MLALGGTMVAKGPNGEREVAATDFFQGFLESALAPDELLTEVRVPKVAGAGWSFQKFTRRAQDWAIVGVAAVHNGTTGVALVNMGSTPILAQSVVEALRSGASAAEAAEKAADDAQPQADLNASVEYRVHLAKVLVRRGAGGSRSLTPHHECGTVRLSEAGARGVRRPRFRVAHARSSLPSCGSNRADARDVTRMNEIGRVAGRLSPGRTGRRLVPRRAA